MRILITNIVLKERSGTELYTRDLALGLFAAGHEPWIYSPEIGETGTEIAQAGVRVTNDLRELPGAPDVIHGNHFAETVQALIRFPETPAVFVLHDPTAWHSLPPLSPQIRRYVAVDYNCHARLTDHYQVPEKIIRVIYNSYDPQRFMPRKEPVKNVARALVFSHYAEAAGFVEPIREACAELGIALDVIGEGMKRSHPKPWEILHGYDLVFAIGRCALEASATGAAVITCGAPGLGPFTTAANVLQLFGKDYPYVPFTKEGVIAEIKKVNPGEVQGLSEYVRKNHALPLVVDKYLALYGEALGEGVPRPTDPLEAFLCATAQRMQKMEFQTPVATGRDVSARLSRRISKKVRLRLLHAPETTADPFVVDVEVENRSGETLSPNPPYPVNFSYRWISGAGTHANKMVVQEGRRTALPGVLKPGEKMQCRVGVNLPAESGTYLLRVTLVQEGVMWLDELKPGVAAETQVRVAKACYVSRGL